jgi:hypothetical protein
VIYAYYELRVGKCHAELCTREYYLNATSYNSALQAALKGWMGKWYEYELSFVGQCWFGLMIIACTQHYFDFRCSGIEG